MNVSSIISCFCELSIENGKFVIHYNEQLDYMYTSLAVCCTSSLQLTRVKVT